MSPSPATLADVDLANSDYRQIFCAALQGLCANPTVFTTYTPDPREAVRLAIECTFYTIVGVGSPNNGEPDPYAKEAARAQTDPDNEVPF